MRVGLYARVSTHDQQTLPMQIQAMRDYVVSRGWTIVFAVEDVGSGAAERPRREDLMKAARRRQLDAILVSRLGRFQEYMMGIGQGHSVFGNATRFLRAQQARAAVTD